MTRVLQIAADAPERGDALLALYRAEIDAILVSGVYDPERMARLYATLESDAMAALRDRRDRAGESPQVEVLGLAIPPSDMHPGGPALGDYLDAAERFRILCAGLFSPDLPFPDRMEQVLGGISGGRSVRNATSAGRGYGPATIRRVPAGADARALASGIYRPHCENLYLQIPAFDPVRAELDLVGIISFFVTVGNADAGGELVIYPGVRWQEGKRETFPPTEALMAKTPDEPPHLVFCPKPGDAVLFSAGCVYHRVTPVQGPRARWTIGGFCAPAVDGSAFRYWA